MFWKPSPVTGHIATAKINTQKLNLAVKVQICLEHFTDNIGRKYLCSALDRRLSNKMIYSKNRPRFRWNHSSFPGKLHGISVNLIKFDFWYVNNSCVNTVRQHFPWSILYFPFEKHEIFRRRCPCFSYGAKYYPCFHITTCRGFFRTLRRSKDVIFHEENIHKILLDSFRK